MSNETNEKSVVSDVYQEYRAEFRKIVWPSWDVLRRHTITVIAVSLIFGGYIAMMDGIFGSLFRQFVRLITG